MAASDGVLEPRWWLPSHQPPLFRVLLVCTGNQCRSPQAEALLRARMPARVGRWHTDQLRISSAGTRTGAGLPIDPRAAIQLARLGAPTMASHRSQPVTRALLAESDLVLTMTALQAEEVQALGRRRVARRLFTLVGFTVIVEALADGAGLAAGTPQEDDLAAFLRRVVVAADASRHVPMPPAFESDISDPRGYPVEVYRRSADSIDEQARRLTRALVRLASSAPAARRPPHAGA